PFHIRLAKRNGINADERIALIIDMAFYVGWPKAVAALHIAMNDMKS
ncbi:carboxymuconolactone decarboxylase family protein, partial [Bacillus anthracis]